MYRRPIRLIATVLLAILIPSLLVTSLGLLAVFQADRYVHDHGSEPFRRRLRELRKRIEDEWGRVIDGYAVRVRDGDDRRAHLARMRDEPQVREVLVSDLEGLHLVPAEPPFPELWVDLEPPALVEARRLEVRGDDPSASLARYTEILTEAEDDAVLLEALLGASRTSYRLGSPSEAVAYLKEALQRYGDTVDGSGVLRKLPILYRKFEIESSEGRPEADQTAKDLAAVLRREGPRLGEQTVAFYRELLAPVLPVESLLVPSTAVSAGRSSSVLGEEVLASLQDVLVPERKPEDEDGTPKAHAIDGPDGTPLHFVSFPTRSRDVDVHLLLDRGEFLEDLRLFAEELGIDRESLLVGVKEGRLLAGYGARQRGREVAATLPLAAPFDTLEMRYAPPPGSLPPGFRSFDVIYLTTFAWAVVVLVLMITVGVFFTLRAVLREMRTARLKSDFVSFISHELKTPLAAIRMFTETLQNPLLVDEEERKTCLQMIQDESERLTDLINKVIEYSRIERHQKAFRFTRCDLESVVREAVDIFHTHNQESPREVEINSVQRISRINLDRESMVELVLNLLSNASKYSPPDRKIVVNLRESVDEISVDVVDQGVGIRKRDQKRIFDKFYRADDYLSREVEGVGLGLALARYIAKVHNGDIRVTSQVHSGSTFSLHLKKTEVFAE